MHPRKQLDLEFGRTNEDAILNTLKQFFKDPTITKTVNRNAAFDFVGDNKFIELKSRNCLSTTYSTTMIGINKFKNLNPDTDYYCVFKFTDAILYIKYNKDLFDEYESKPGGRNDRGRPERAVYFFIPVNNLEAITIEQECLNDF